jgi:hypothetical protein
MYVCILNQGGEIVVHRNMPPRPEAWLKNLAPYRDDIVIAVEGIFTWYWVLTCGPKKGCRLFLGTRSI